MNEDKWIDKATNAFAQIVAAVMFFVFAAATTATDPFFRKNMGERYLTLWRVLLSTAGWGAITFVAYINYEHSGFGQYPKVRIACGAIITITYFAVALIRYFGMRRKRQAGEYWHSRSRGESVFGEEGPIRDFCIEVTVTIGLAIFSIWYGLFFGLSRLLGYASSWAHRQGVYNQYLDIQDARIEQQFMEVALRDGLAPGRTAGFYRPLPHALKGEFRSHVANVVTEDLQQKYGYRPPSATSPQGQKQPVQAGPLKEETPTREDVAIGVAWQAAAEREVETAPLGMTLVAVALADFLRSKLLRIAVIVCLLFAVFMHWGVPYLHSRRTHVRQPVQAPAAQTFPNAQTPQSESPPAPTAAAMEIPSKPEQVVAIATAAPTQNEATRPHEDPVAVAQALFADQQRIRLEQAQRARTEMLGRIKAVFDEQSGALAKFKSDCEGALTSNSNRIAIVKWYTTRLNLRVKNRECRLDYLDVAQRQDAALNQLAAQYDGLSRNSSKDPQQLLMQLPGWTAALSQDREKIASEISNLSDEIQKAPRNPQPTVSPE